MACDGRGRAFGEDAALVEEEDAVADFLDIAHVVGGVENGGLA